MKDLKGPYQDRELSWLDFDARVLELTEDPTIPLLERVRFLSIFSSNLDEFFMVRVASLKAKIERGSTTINSAGYAPQELLKLVLDRTQLLVNTQAERFRDVIVPELKEHGIEFSKIDFNNDNLISKTELMNHRKREFSFADTNHDGALSTEELIAARNTKVSFRAKRMMQRLDQNLNGVLEFDELNSVVSNRFGNIFESLDLNNDGHLSKKEFSKLKKRKG